MVINTALRLVYPFLPVFSRALGIERSALANLLAARNALGLFTPFIEPLVNRLGKPRAMLLAVVLCAVGSGLPLLWPSVPAFAAMLLAVIVAKMLYDTALQGYFGDTIPYERRGRVLALIEISWATSFLIGVPAAGWLMARSLWNSPFGMLAGLGILSGLGIWRIFPPGAGGGDSHPTRKHRWRKALGHWHAIAALSVGILIAGANEILSVAYGAWLEDRFALQLGALGLSAMLIGSAELLGEGGVAAFADRLGKRRAVALGCTLSAAAYAALPYIAVNRTAALIGLFLAYLSFEFTMVSSFPLMTEIVPDARTSFISANLAGVSLGRMLGALVGGWIFTAGFAWVGWLAGGVNMLAAVIVVLWVREGIAEAQRENVLG